MENLCETHAAFALGPDGGTTATNERYPFAEAPTPAGGEIVPGDYVLTKSTQYFGDGSGNDTNKHRAKIRFIEGGKFVHVGRENIDPDAIVGGTFTTDAAEKTITFKHTCKDGGTTLSPTAMKYSAETDDAGVHFHLFVANTGPTTVQTRTFTKTP